VAELPVSRVNTHRHGSILAIAGKIVGKLLGNIHVCTCGKDGGHGEQGGSGLGHRHSGDAALERPQCQVCMAGRAWRRVAWSHGGGGHGWGGHGGGCMGATGGEAHALVSASASGRSGGRIGGILETLAYPMATPIAMRTLQWSPPHRPRSISNPHPRRPFSPLHQPLGITVTTHEDITPTCSNVQGDGDRWPPRRHRQHLPTWRIGLAADTCGHLRRTANDKRGAPLWTPPRGQRIKGYDAGAPPESQ